MRKLAVLILAAMGVAGCTNSPTPAPSSTPTPAPATSATSAATPVAACLVGTWLSSSVQGGSNVTGGANVRIMIAPDGAALVDFTQMEPVTFAAPLGQTTIKGSFVYRGEVSSKIRTAGATATSGAWEPAGSVDWSQVKLTVDITEPVRGRPADNLPLRDFLGDKSSQVGGVVDIDPMLGKATYTCEGSSTLILTPQNPNGLKWTLTRKP